MVLLQQGMDRVHHSDRAFVAADDDCHTWAWFEIGWLIDHSIKISHSAVRRSNFANNLFASFCDNRRLIINVGGPNNASDNIMPNSARKQIARWATFSSG
jgi:hypothetical protein